MRILTKIGLAFCIIALIFFAMLLLGDFKLENNDPQDRCEEITVGDVAAIRDTSGDWVCVRVEARL